MLKCAASLSKGLVAVGYNLIKLQAQFKHVKYKTFWQPDTSWYATTLIALDYIQNTVNFTHFKTLLQY